MQEIRAVNSAMKIGGRVMLRSAGLRPWYISNFEEQGFRCERAAARMPGTCIDRYVVFVHNIFDIRLTLSCAGSTCTLPLGFVRKNVTLFHQHQRWTMRVVHRILLILWSSRRLLMIRLRFLPEYWGVGSYDALAACMRSGHCNANIDVQDFACGLG